MPHHKQTVYFNAHCMVSVMGFALGLAGFAVPAGAQAPPGQGRPPAVSVHVVTEQEVNPPAEYAGRVEAIQSVDLRARVEGFLEKVKFQEGSDVHANEVLFGIEQAPYQAKVNAAKAQVAQAQATLTKAGQYLKRLKAVRAGGVSATDLDSAVSEELQAKAQLQGAEASLEQAELDLGYTTIRAPIDGRIGRMAYTKGNLVSPSSGSLARIVQLDPIRVVYSVSENDYVSVKMKHSKASLEELNLNLVPRIRMPNGEMYKTPGRLEFVDNQVDAGTGTIAVRVVFDNPDKILLPGQYVTVLVSRSEAVRMPVVPQSAVQEDREGRYVFVVDAENQVQQRRITTGAVTGTNWAVESGLLAGEKIIVQGVQKVRPGIKVETAPDDAQN